MAVKRYNGSSWDTVAGLGAQGAAAQSSSITTWVKTASGGETSLTGSSDSSTTLAYTPGQEQFFINGVLQVRGSDYTATNGTSITGITALVAGDIATVTTVNAFSVTGAVPLSTVTANGDLIVGTSSGAVGRLGIGSTGNLLTVAGGVPTWAAAPASGGMTLISETVASNLSNLSLTSIPQTHKQLMLVWSGIYHSDTSSQFNLRFNNNSSSTAYSRGGYAAYDSTINAFYSTDNQADSGNNAVFGNNLSTSSTDMLYAARGILLIDNYASSTRNKFYRIENGFINNANVQRMGENNGVFNSTTAITSIDIYRAGAGNFSNITNTSIRLYGIS